MRGHITWIRSTLRILLISLFIFATFHNIFAQTKIKPRGNSLHEDELKKELTALKNVVLSKIENDSVITSEAFADSENIFRSLRVAYSFKTVLNTVSNTFTIFGLPEELMDIKNATSLTEARVNTALTAGSVLLIWENIKEDAGKLALTFNSQRYVENVRQMLNEAGNTQPLIGFDAKRYAEGIRYQFSTSRGQEIINVRHLRMMKPCSTLRGPQSETKNPVAFRGLNEAKHYIGSVFQKLNKLIDESELSSSDANQLILLVRMTKTGMIRSKIDSTNFDISLPASGNCIPVSTAISLGRIAGGQQTLRLAFTALDKNLKIEQVGTVKTAADTMVSAVTTYLKDGSQVKEALKATNKVSLAFDIGNQINKKFERKSADPGELIGDLPQEMLMAMPQEVSQTVLAIDTLDAFIHAVIQPVVVVPPVANPPGVPGIPTLFLFDVSGSMSENNKIGQARTAGLDALREMKESRSTPTSVMTFSGDQCSGNVTKKLLGYTSDLSAVEKVMRYNLPPPNGGTPLPQAKTIAFSDLSAYLRSSPNTKEGRIILLSDGQSTCGEIRPPGIFSRRYDFSLMKGSPSGIRYFTIGFDVPAGSVAERDLQYLASESGGKYYNAADREQLIRAMRKQVRQYLPRACNSSNTEFANGLRGFSEYDYATAMAAFVRYTAANPADACGYYNLALASEANDHYKKAAENYRKYLSVAPTSPDRLKIEAKIAEMNEESRSQFDYYTRLIASDLEYLRSFYQTVFNRSSSDLAAEFDGFVFEKREFYVNLPDTLEIDEKWLVNDTKDIASSMDTLAKRRQMPSFDRDAVSLLTIPIGQIEDMLERLSNYQRKKM